MVCVCVCISTLVETGAKQFYYGSLTKGSLTLSFYFPPFLLFDKHFRPSHVSSVKEEFIAVYSDFL